ncbi:MAG: hypothetical protein UY07_C0006G0045 [Parcubacteria group bacterium GW2011_GWA1_47_8]|nr:MAG: hypothetical protein UY07_C0006G0045 [Parcubacteria group bacterium GW2011_GWA1_47_8]
MNVKTKFSLALIPAVLFVIVAEATIPALIARLAMWAGAYKVFAVLLGIATFVAILLTSIFAILAVDAEMMVTTKTGDDKVVPLRSFKGGMK